VGFIQMQIGMSIRGNRISIRIEGELCCCITHVLILILVIYVYRDVYHSLYPTATLTIVTIAEAWYDAIISTYIQ